MATMESMGVTGLPIAPAGTLTKIAQRNLKGVALFNLNSPTSSTKPASSSPPTLPARIRGDPLVALKSSTGAQYAPAPPSPVPAAAASSPTKRCAR